MSDHEKMTLQEVADFLDCTTETVEVAARNGRLAAVKFGRSWVFLRSALMEGLHQTALGNMAPPRRRSESTNDPRGHAGVLVSATKLGESKSGRKRRPRPDLSGLMGGLLGGPTAND